MIKQQFHAPRPPKQLNRTFISSNDTSIEAPAKSCIQRLSDQSLRLDCNVNDSHCLTDAEAVTDVDGLLLLSERWYLQIHDLYIPLRKYMIYA